MLLDCIKGKNNVNGSHDVTVSEALAQLPSNLEGALRLNTMLNEAYQEMVVIDFEGDSKVLSESMSGGKINYQTLSEGLKEKMSDYWDRAKKFLKDMKDKFIQFVKNFKDTFLSYIMDGKKFAVKFGDKIKSKASKGMNNFSYEGYEFAKDMSKNATTYRDSVKTNLNKNNSDVMIKKKDVYNKAKTENAFKEIDDIISNFKSSEANNINPTKIKKDLYGSIDKKTIKPSSSDISEYIKYITDGYSDDINAVSDTIDEVDTIVEDMLNKLSEGETGDLSNAEKSDLDASSVKKFYESLMKIVRMTGASINKITGILMGAMKSKYTQYVGAIKKFFRHKNKALSESFNVDGNDNLLVEALDIEIEFEIDNALYEGGL